MNHNRPEGHAADSYNSCLQKSPFKGKPATTRPKLMRSTPRILKESSAPAWVAGVAGVAERGAGPRGRGREGSDSGSTEGRERTGDLSQGRPDLPQMKQNGIPKPLLSRPLGSPWSQPRDSRSTPLTQPGGSVLSRLTNAAHEAQRGGAGSGRDSAEEASGAT